MDKIKNKKGLFSVDAAFAVIIVTVMSFFFFLLLHAFITSFHDLESRQKIVSLVVFSNQIVREEGADKTNTETIANLISIPSLESYLNQIRNSNSNSYGFNYIEVRLSSESNPDMLIFNKTFQNISSKDLYCINRLILIKGLDESKENGVLTVCVN